MTNSEVIGDESVQRRSASCSWRDTLGRIGILRRHWPEYLMEAGEMTIYMFFTCVFATLLQHPASPLRHLISSDLSRRALMGLAIGATESRPSCRRGASSPEVTSIRRSPLLSIDWEK